MIVTVAQFRQALGGVQFTQGQDSSAALLLSGVQAQLEDYINRPLEPTLCREQVQADPTGYCVATYDPILKVIDVRTTTNRVWADAGSDPYITPPLDRGDGPAAAQRVIDTAPSQSARFYGIRPGGIVGAAPWSNLIITYVAGEVPPAHCKTMIIEVAKRIWNLSNNDTAGLSQGQVTEEDEEEGKSRPPSGTYWTENELKLFDRLRRRTVV